MNKSITVFTPSYNRAHLLNRLYESLLKQTNKKFEWIIVDDGSTDNTQKIVNDFILEGKIEIKYQYQKNGGKHRAINRGLDLASGYLFFIVDSDDYLTNDAIEKIIAAEGNLNDKSKFAGIAFCKGYSNNQIIGTTFSGDFIDATSLERKKYNINGDKAEVFYTNILRQYKFPEFEGEKFITEALVWNRIANDGYKLRWFQDIIYICEYLDGGLTSKGNKIFSRGPKGLQLYIKELIEFEKLGLIQRLLKYGFYSDAVYDYKNNRKAANDLKINLFTLYMGVLLRKSCKLIKAIFRVK